MENFIVWNDGMMGLSEHIAHMEKIKNGNQKTLKWEGHLENGDWLYLIEIYWDAMTVCIRNTKLGLLLQSGRTLLNNFL